MFVLVNDIERDFLGTGSRGHCLWNHDGDEVAGFDGSAWFCGLSVEQDVLLADQILDARARKLAEFGREVGIEAVVIAFG